MQYPQTPNTYTGPRQHDALKAIKAYWRHHSESPTCLELGEALGISRVSAHLLVKKLARDGLVVTEPKMTRGMEVV